MISYRRLAMRVLGYPLRVPTNTPRPASHRVTALALTAAMVAGMAAPAYAGTYYIGDGDITITKDEKGDVYVKHADNKDKSNGDVDNGDIIIKGGKRSEDTTAPGGSSSEGGTPATSAAKSASATLKVEDSENEDKDMVYPGDTKGNTSSTTGSGEENENQSTEKDQPDTTTGGEGNKNQSNTPTSGSESGSSGSGGSGTSGSEGDTTGNEENKTQSGDTTGSGTPAEGAESTGSSSPAPESQFTYTGAPLKVAAANDDEETRNESTTTLKTAADNFKAAAQNVIRIINKLAGNDNTLNVTLDNVNIDVSSRQSTNAALSVEGVGDTKITLVGDNKLTSGNQCAGLEHNEKSDDGSSSVGTGKLTITSEKEDGKDTGSLTATGDSGAAGIGGAWSKGAGTIKIAGGNITAISPISQSGRNDNDGGAGIGSGAKATGSTNTNIIISGGTIVNAQGGFGGDGIGGGSGSKNITVNIEGGTIGSLTTDDNGKQIPDPTTGALGGNAATGEQGGHGIYSKGQLFISGSADIINAKGGDSQKNGGSGIHSSGELNISPSASIKEATGGNADSGTGGSGIRSDGTVKIWGGTITKTTGGSGKSGGDGIGSYGDLTISGSAKIVTAQGGTSTDGNGGSGISSGGILTIEGSANIGTAQGGASTNGTGGDGIHSGSVVKISGDTITKATGGNATGENSTGGSGIGGSFVNVAGGTINTTGGSGKSGGAGVSTESGIVSIGNSDTPLDLTATSPDADNAIRGRDGKKLDEIIHLAENGKLGLVKLVENGVTRLFHNGVYTKTALPDFSVSETHPLGEWRTTKAPTCTELGERQRSCKVEHCVVTETEELPALGHQWSGWMPVQGDSSREYRICAVCNAVEYRDVSHNSGFIIPTNLRVLDSTQTDILQNAQLVRLSQINDVLYIDVALETASLQGVLSDLTGLRSENIETVVFSTERCTSTLSLSDVAALGAGDTPFTLSHSGSTASFIVGGADHSALLR